MKSVYVLAAVLLAANVAAASQEGVSEYHQHAAKGEMEVTPEFAYKTMDIETNTTGITAEASGMELGVEGEYGISEGMSAGVELGYESSELKVKPAGTTNDTEVTGLKDVILFVRGSNGTGSGRLAYGLNLGYSLGDEETTSGATKDETDAQTGGMSLAPYVGYEMAVGPGVWGAQVNYTWLGERTQKNGTTETKVEDGNGFGLATFYEYAWSAENKIGAALAYDMAGATKSGTPSATQNDKNNTMTLSLYAPMKAADKLELIPRLDWATQDYDSNLSNAKKADMLALSVAARWHM